MTVRATTGLAAAVLQGALLLAGASALAGGGVDPNSYERMTHRQCFKMKDTGKAKGIVDLFTVHYAEQSGCSFTNADLLCLPAHKTLQSATFDKAPVPPDPLEDEGNVDAGYPIAQICYKAKCPKADLRDVEYRDPFAVRSLDPKKTAYVCAPAVKRCDDPTRTQFVRGRGQGGFGCRQFDGNQAACETAWMFSRGGNSPIACFYTAINECHGCSPTGPTANSEMCDNACIASSCANPSLTTGNRCSEIMDQPTCDGSFGAGWFGVHNCFWNAGDARCEGCGPANELSGNCSNSCRAPVNGS